MLVIEFSYNFLYVWNCIKLYDKKFLINGNCMTRSFGQPGSLQFFSLHNALNRVTDFQNALNTLMSHVTKALVVDHLKPSEN